MSGRSAYVRAKKGELADRTARRQYQEFHVDDNYLYGYGASLSRQAIPTMPSFQAVSHNRRRQSISSGGSTYAYPVAPPRKPRPIIVASAIEKSDFRTHLDGMSASLRGKLGRLIKGGDDPPTRQQRPPGTASNSSDAGSRSTGAFTPSVTAVPSLSPSTPPSDLPAAYPALVPPTTSSGPRSKPQESVIHKIRRFEGGGKLPQLGWKSLSNNPELWDESGDTFVYMYMRGSRTKPPPSFRIKSKVIERSGSRAFIYQLHHVMEPDGWPRFYPSEVSSSDDGNSVDDTTASYESPQEPIPGPTDHSDNGEVDSIRPLNLSTIKRRKVRAPRGIQHELYIPWPGTETGTHSTIWHITTRNFFAVMYDANALVGTTLYEAMLRLFERVNTYPDYLDRNISRVAWITDYATRHGFDDVRNNPSYAASLLAFSENSGVQWREGYIEAFPHCVGMLNMGLQTVPEWRHITPHTKMYLQNASMEIEERVHRAQAWLFSFDFSEMWPTTSAPPSTARGCFDRLRKWLCKYYENAFLHWPPTNDLTWLTRDIVVRLKNDFEGLYDYLVDRDIIFDGTEYRPGQKWVITSMSGQAFRADTSELAFTDILLGFDERNNFPHIPHPYPITPSSMPLHTKPKSAFTLKKPASQAEIIAQSRRKALSYAEASNVYTLRDQYMHTDLVTNFIRFEQADLLDSIDPFEARRGRWLLIYGILQVLATVSVDSPNLRYKDGVQYHLSPQMKGVVPWAEPGSAREEEAEHKRSHCWVVPSTWIPSVPKARPGAHKPILWGQFGDGRSRADSLDKPLTRAQEASIGVKRAEEWVANNAGQLDAGSDSVGGGTSEAQMSVGKKTGRSNSGVSGAEAGSSAESSTESAQMAARRRRALIHGFTDFQVPDEW